MRTTCSRSRSRRAKWIPIQLFDSALAASATTLGLLAGIGRGHAALAWLASYAAGRLVLEILRGDTRPSWRGLSEAQWISVAAVIAGAILLPVLVPAAASVAVAAALLTVSRRWRLPRALWITHPEHLTEVHRVVTAAARLPHPRLVTTSARIAITVHAMTDGVLDVVTCGPTFDQTSTIASYLAMSWRVIGVLPGREPGLSHVLLCEHSLDG